MLPAFRSGKIRVFAGFSALASMTTPSWALPDLCCTRAKRVSGEARGRFVPTGGRGFKRNGCGGEGVGGGGGEVQRERVS
jgi:hypothetical protein